MIFPYLDYRPELAGTPKLADRAAIIGRTTAGAELVLQEYATLRADGERIHVGDRVYFGARACVHIADGIYSTEIADDVTVGRYGLVHACRIGEGVVVAEAGIVMDAAEVGPYALIGPGALVPPRKKLPGGWVYAGNPVAPVREISRDELRRLAASIRAGTPAAAARASDVPPPGNAPYLPEGAAGDGMHALGGKRPRIENGYVAETALLIGDVRIAADAGVYFGCVLKAGAGRICIGVRSNVQDSTIVEIRSGELVIAPDVTVGHNVRMGSGSVAEEALIGMGAIVGESVVVERGGCIGAGAWVEPHTVVKAGWIWAGRPARPFREMKPVEREAFARGREVYVGYGRAYRRA
jgi:gamma-carbonic anhydrase